MTVMIMTVIVPLENYGDGEDDNDDNDNNDDYDDDDLMMMTILVVCGVHTAQAPMASAQDMTCRHPRPKPSFTSQH